MGSETARSSDRSSTPHGASDPYGGRGLWGDVHGPGTPTLANQSFDAEVGDISPETWQQVRQRAIALHIVQVQQSAHETCATDSGAACQIAWEQASQRILGVTLEAGQNPQIPSPLPATGTGVHLPTLSVGIGGHLSGGIAAYGDVGAYVIAGDTTGYIQILQPYQGGGGTTGIFGEATPVIFISNAPLGKWPGWSG